MPSKILVLDDEENYTQMLRDLLEQNRYQVVTATVPEKALALLNETDFDLVVTDYKMPGMDGASFLKSARKIHPDLPIIMISGLMNTPDLVKVANMSVTLVLEKPLNTRDFLDNVRRFATPLEAAEGDDTSTAVPVADKGVEKFDFPEPIYFAAESLSSRTTLQQVWEADKSDEWLAFRQPEGGDAELLLKELAMWYSGECALACNFFDAEDMDTAAGMHTMEQVLIRSIASPVFGIRIQDRPLSAINAKRLADFVEREGQGKLKPVFILTQSDPNQLQPSEFSLANKTIRVITVPPLVMRPADVALYAKRIAAQVASVDCDKPKNVFTGQVAFALLCHEWPGNLSELNAVIKALVKRAQGGEIRSETVCEILSGRSDFSPSYCEVEPQNRLGIYLQLRQRIFLRCWQARHDLSIDELANQLGMDNIASISDMDLLKLDLINPDWARMA